MESILLKTRNDAWKQIKTCQNFVLEHSKRSAKKACKKFLLRIAERFCKNTLKKMRLWTHIFVLVSCFDRTFLTGLFCAPSKIVFLFFCRSTKTFRYVFVTSVLTLRLEWSKQQKLRFLNETNLAVLTKSGG